MFDVGKEGNIYYIVMEMLEGDTLSDIIRREGPLDQMRAIDIAKQIAQALSSAHKKNIIHRDVKPHNILMSEDGTAKIADFGIAKAVNSGTIVNNTSTVMGSVHYLSPEQARGGYVDARSDIYSLGIVLYEMLTGSVPFDGDNPVSVAMMHMNEAVQPPSKINPAVSPALDKVVLKATAKHQPDRYRSADEMYEALVQAENTILSERSGMGLKEFYAIPRDDGRQDEDYDNYNDYDEYDEDEEKKKKGLFAGKFASRKKNSVKDGGSSGKKGRKSSKKRKILPVVLALICAIPLSIVLLNVFGNSGNTVKIPNVIGMTEEKAAAELEKAGLEYTLGTPVISDEYESGEVVSTDPDVGREVKEGYKVRLILSKGSDSESVKTPNTVGKKLDEAKELLEKFDLKCGSIEYDEESDLPDGTVISQDPEAGEEVETGTKVNLVVSRAAENTEIPDVRGLSQSAAERKTGRKRIPPWKGQHGIQ